MDCRCQVERFFKRMPISRSCCLMTCDAQAHIVIAGRCRRDECDAALAVLRELCGKSTFPATSTANNHDQLWSLFIRRKRVAFLIVMHRLYKSFLTKTRNAAGL